MKFISNKFTKVIILSVTLLVLIGGFYYIFTPGKIGQISASHVLYNDVDELTAYADLIIIGQPEKDFSEYTPSITYTNEGRYEDFYTITDIKIIKVIKGNYSLPNIPVAQHAALINSPVKLQKDLLISEDYSVMQKNNKYLLFLKKVDDGTYGVISINQGKFNIDNLDKNEKEIIDRNNQYKELKQAVLEKYSDKIK